MDHEVVVEIAGIRYVLSSDDEYVDHLGEVFEPQTVQLCQILATGSRTALDVGANIGCTALLLSGLAENVHAYEALPSTAKFLQRNLDRAGVSNVVVEQYGLGDTDAVVPFTFRPEFRAGGFVSDQTAAIDGHSREEVSIRRLDSLDVANVDFVKIDVEGFEGHVLSGASRTLSRDRPNVLLELNHWCLNAFQRTSVPDFFDQLRSIFPALLAVDDAHIADLHDDTERYVVMYHHILHNRFKAIVGGFDPSALDGVYDLYIRGFPA